MLFHVEQEGTMLLAEIMGTITRTEVETAFTAVTGMGQTENYGTMLAAAIPDTSIYYISEELCGIVSEKIVSRPDLAGVTTVVSDVARTINGEYSQPF